MKRSLEGEAKKLQREIGNLIDANVDKEINGIIHQSLFNEIPATGLRKQYQLSVLENGNVDQLMDLINSLFKESFSLDHEELLRCLIEKNKGIAQTAYLPKNRRG